VRAFAVLLPLFVSACGPMIAARGSLDVVPHIARAPGESLVFVTRDGLSLGYERWEAAEPRAVIVAFHGMNDYARFIRLPAEFWASEGVSTYAIDQRGFGRTPNRGIWAGQDAMVEDFRDFTELVRAKHRGLPLYILGESMGGAVVLNGLARADAPMNDGVILVAPAVWGFSTMNPLYSAALWLGAHVFPDLTFTGSSLSVRPSDNREVLIDLGADPNVIKPTRPDAIYGLVSLMDRALKAAPKVQGRTLILYGAKDEIVPRRPMELLVARMTNGPRMAFYANGFHLLLRDGGREAVWNDVLAFVDRRAGALPSGAEVTPLQFAGGR
jgi:acylglycerol lipase